MMALQFVPQKFVLTAFYGDDNVRYADGAEWKDDCNDCYCDEATYYCTTKPCGAECVYTDGMSYDSGEEFESADGCNTCTCKDGTYTCTTNIAVCKYNDEESYCAGETWTDATPEGADCLDCYCDVDGKSYCNDDCTCTTNDDCTKKKGEGWYCDKPTCDDLTGACFECTEDNGCLTTQVCGCDDKTYDNSIDATSQGVIVRDYGECPACYPKCKTAAGEVCCPGCYNTLFCAKLAYGGQCPIQNCGGKYY